ncbi:helix-turn-helix transcriptional regulator [Streptococcus uberis]|uniref:helix-turn-helix transcriptional regulator n=1 Tax=Streptococcus uberis TaxID=1349 RepID=UPI003D6A655F
MIGEFIKGIRVKHNIRVVDLAGIVGVSQPYISNIENEKRYPTVELFFRIIYALSELSPFNSDVSFSLENVLEHERKADFFISDTLEEFWNLHNKEILEYLNSFIDEDEDEIRDFEDFKEYVNHWTYDDMISIPAYKNFLDDKYGVDNYGEFLNYYDYSSYNDKDYVKSLVVDYWYQEYLNDFLEFFEINSINEQYYREQYAEIVLNTVTEVEAEIYKVVRSLKNKTGMFSDYIFQQDINEEFTDLNIFDNHKFMSQITLDGKKLTMENIASIRNTINGIRYERKL